MRLFKKDSERKKSFWKRAVDLALTDVRVAFGGMDQESLETLEERLLAADFGVPATLRLVEGVEALARRGKIRGGAELREALRSQVEAILAGGGEPTLARAQTRPTVYLIVGVNGTGKTTSIAKLAHHLQRTGSSVLVAAADTYRAGAVAQLSTWADRIGCEFVGGESGGDPAAVAFDAIDAAQSRGIDIVIVDTAGRLHTHRNLMDELRKVHRVIEKKVDGAPHETLIVLDATVGQNGLSQARAFGDVVGLSGIILSKLDSSAKGGIVVALKEELSLPVKLVGTGEGIEDLGPFRAADFVAGIFEE